MCFLLFGLTVLQVRAQRGSYESPAVWHATQTVTNTENKAEFVQREGTPLKIVLHFPKGEYVEAPVVVWLPPYWDSPSTSRCPIKYLTKFGYVVACVEYRSSKVAPFPAQLYDCKAAVRWLRLNAAQYHLAADHIAVYGAVGGAHLAALLGTTGDIKELEGTDNPGASSKVQAVCAISPPVNFSLIKTNESYLASAYVAPARLLGGPIGDLPEEAQVANPSRYADYKSAPFFIVQGTRDWTNPQYQSVLLHYSLASKGVRTQLKLVRGWHFTEPPEEVVYDMHFFLEKYLKVRKVYPTGDGAVQ
ncbi:MAG: alpha/beta hydrolase [Verrucomicrobiota bacterium]